MHKIDHAAPGLSGAATLETRFNEGFRLHQNGQLADAERIYEEILERYPNHFRALHLLGVIALQTQRIERAIRLIGKAIALNGSVADAYSNLAHALLEQKRPEDALVSCDSAISLKPDLAAAHTNRGKALLELNRSQEAIESFETAIAFDPNHAAAHNNLGVALLKMDRPDEARLSIEKSLTLMPDDPQLWDNLARSLNVSSSWEEAESACRKALALNPNYSSAWANLGCALNQLERWDEAIDACRTAVTLKPAHGDAWNQLGYALHAVGRAKEAEDAARQAVAVNPDAWLAWLNLSRFLRAHDKRSEALQAMHRAVELMPTSRAPSYLYEANQAKVSAISKRLVVESRENGNSFAIDASQICALHRMIMQGLLQTPGEFRKGSVVIGLTPRMPPNCRSVPGLVDAMCDYITDNWTARHSIHLASFALWHLNWIHPFYDGNGRLARVLCTTILCLKNSLPFSAVEPIVTALTKTGNSPDFFNCLSKAQETYEMSGDIERATQPIERWIEPLIRQHLR